MSQTKTIIKGIVHGRTIELAADAGLPDGQEVDVILKPTIETEGLAPGEGIRRSAGAWADDPEGLEEYLEWNRQQRKIGRPKIES